MGSRIAGDVVEEAARLVEAGRAAGVELRVLGGAAVRLHATDGVHPALERPCRDIDLVAARKSGRDVVRLLESEGYSPNERFNALNAGRRLVAYDPARERQVDVFVGEFKMCHTIPIADRLQLEPLTVPIAELLLTKLQIVHLNRKDLQDLYAILLDHDVAGHDRDAVNADYVASLLAADWGLWRTSRQTVEAAGGLAGGFDLDPEERRVVAERLERLWRRVEAEPKSLRWKARAKIGERTKWYEEPEEIDHGADPGASAAG